MILASLGVHDLPLFAAAALLLNVTPGPDMLFVAGCAAARGRRAGVQAALGVGVGCLLHIALAAVGLSALMAAAALAFGVVKWLGAAYLVWCGIGMLRSRKGEDTAAAMPGQGGGRSPFWQGALTNALNPKVALFFLAFLPQFIDPAAGQRAIGFLALGLVFDAGGTAVNIAVALLASGIREHLAQRSGAHQRLGAWLRRGVGALFVGLGLRLALSER